MPIIYNTLIETWSQFCSKFFNGYIFPPIHNLNSLAWYSWLFIICPLCTGLSLDPYLVLLIPDTGKYFRVSNTLSLCLDFSSLFGFSLKSQFTPSLWQPSLVSPDSQGYFPLGACYTWCTPPLLLQSCLHVSLPTSLRWARKLCFFTYVLLGNRSTSLQHEWVSNSNTLHLYTTLWFSKYFNTCLDSHKHYTMDTGVNITPNMVEDGDAARLKDRSPLISLGGKRDETRSQYLLKPSSLTTLTRLAAWFLISGQICMKKPTTEVQYIHLYNINSEFLT